jgi:hypothetical protein
VVDRQTEERIARNDATFRDANEHVRAAASALGVDDDQLPFICECAEPSCTEVVLLAPESYARIRAHPRHFLNVPGHEVAAQGSVAVVETHAEYLVVEKIGHAGEVAEALAHDATEETPVR